MKEHHFLTLVLCSPGQTPGGLLAPYDASDRDLWRQPDPEKEPIWIGDGTAPERGPAFQSRHSVLEDGSLWSDLAPFDGLAPEKCLQIDGSILVGGLDGARPAATVGPDGRWLDRDTFAPDIPPGTPDGRASVLIAQGWDRWERALERLVSTWMFKGASVHFYDLGYAIAD